MKTILYLFQWENPDLQGAEAVESQLYEVTYKTQRELTKWVKEKIKEISAEWDEDEDVNMNHGIENPKKVILLPKKKHPWVGVKVNIGPKHFQLDDDDWKEMGEGITPGNFFGPCLIHSIGLDADKVPSEHDYVFFRKMIDGAIVDFPEHPINFYELPEELEGLIK